MTATPCWQDPEPRIRLETLIETSTLFSGPLDDRSGIRARQDEALIRELMAHTATTAQTRAQAERFYFGSLDFLVSGEDEPKFHLIEMNGTRMAGLTNVPHFVLNKLLETLCEIANSHFNPAPLILIPLLDNGEKKPTLIVHEQILCAQAIVKGYRNQYGEGRIITYENLKKEASQLNQLPLVVLGLFDEILPDLYIENNRLKLLGRSISMILRDTFCGILSQRFQFLLKDLSVFSFNEIFPISTDKGLTYQAHNELVSRLHLEDLFPPIIWSHAFSREALIELLAKQLQQGSRLVIKPNSRGMGRGVDFFLKNESREAIASKVDASILYSSVGIAVENEQFPYTICEFIESRKIKVPNHQFLNHAFEIRFLLFRDGADIFAIPSIAKVARSAYQNKDTDRLTFLNNVAISKKFQPESALDFVLPLANDETLSILGLERRHLFEICQFATRFVDFLTQERPSA